MEIRNFIFYLKLVWDKARAALLLPEQASISGIRMYLIDNDSKTHSVLLLK